MIRSTSLCQMVAEPEEPSPRVHLRTMRHATSFTTLTDLAAPQLKPIKHFVITLSRSGSQTAPRAPRLRALACDDMLAAMEPLELEPNLLDSRPSTCSLLPPHAPKLLPALSREKVDFLSLPLPFLLGRAAEHAPGAGELATHAHGGGRARRARIAASPLGRRPGGGRRWRPTLEADEPSAQPSPVGAAS